jgi:hypothetical protein
LVAEQLAGFLHATGDRHGRAAGGDQLLHGGKAGATRGADDGDGVAHDHVLLAAKRFDESWLRTRTLPSGSRPPGPACARRRGLDADQEPAAAAFRYCRQFAPSGADLPSPGIVPATFPHTTEGIA